MHHFVHLNLAISLCLGYIVFTAGIDTAVVNEVMFIPAVDFTNISCALLANDEKAANEYFDDLIYLHKCCS